MARRRKKISRVPVKAEIETISHDGRGIARPDGKTTFIQGALPGETVTFEYTRTKKDYDEGVAVSIESASQERVDPECPHFAMCGGCSLQHMAHSQQVVFKQTQLLDLLERVGRCQPQEVLTPIQSQSRHYRNKARLSVRYVEKKDSVLVGFRERKNPRFITEISECVVLNADVSAKIPMLRELIEKFADKRCIAQVEVAAGDEAVALIFRNLTALSDSDCALLREFAKETGFIIYLQPGGPDTVERFYPKTGDDLLHYRLDEPAINYQFHPTDFTQVNAAVNQDMIKKALYLLDLKTTDVVLDLFCGLGNFSLPIATRCEKVLGVEGSQTMVERATMNARANNLKNTEFYCANLEDPVHLKRLSEHRANKLLIDPPRTGAQTIVSNIEKLNPNRIVYVSCNPATLARDAAILVNEKGYILTHAGVMDMFPHTAHVESMAVFIKKE